MRGLFSLLLPVRNLESEHRAPLSVYQIAINEKSNPFYLVPTFFLLFYLIDPRYICYVPSVLAAATMLHAIHQLEPCNPLEYENQLLGVLKICKVYSNHPPPSLSFSVKQICVSNSSRYFFRQEKVEECFQLMLEPVSGGCNKRKYISEPATPNGVLETSFSCDSFNDSWASSDSSSSPLNPLKKLRTQNEKQMQMPSLHFMFIDVLSSP